MGWVPSVMLCVLMYAISRSDQTLAWNLKVSLINISPGFYWVMQPMIDMEWVCMSSSCPDNRIRSILIAVVPELIQWTLFHLPDMFSLFHVEVIWQELAHPRSSSQTLLFFLLTGMGNQNIAYIWKFYSGYLLQKKVKQFENIKILSWYCKSRAEWRRSERGAG